MKHTIEIDGLPEGYEVKNIKVTEKQPWDNGSIAALIYVKKKQPRRIVLEETDDTRSPKKGDYYYYRGCLRRWSKDNHSYNTHKIWRIVEDSGENE